MARADTLPAYFAGFFEPPPFQRRVRAVVSVPVAEFSFPSVSGLFASARRPRRQYNEAYFPLGVI